MEPGPFVCVDGNTHLGLHTGIAAYTHGQRAGISGVPKPFYVVGKDVQNNVVYVAMGADHPALFCTSAVAGTLNFRLSNFALSLGLLHTYSETRAASLFLFPFFLFHQMFTS